MDAPASGVALGVSRFSMFTIYFSFNEVTVCTQKLIHRLCFFWVVFYKSIPTINITRFRTSISSKSMVHLKSTNIYKTAADTFSTKEINNKLKSFLTNLSLFSTFFQSIFGVIGFVIFSHIIRPLYSSFNNFIRIFSSPFSFPQFMSFFFIHNGHYNIIVYNKAI